MTRWHIYCLLCCLGFSTVISAQNRTALEKERKQLLQQISITNKKLASTRNDKASALASYLDLKKQVEQRQRLINSYQTEITLTEENIARTDTIVLALGKDLDGLKQEYSQIMRTALRSKLQQSYFVFLFSSRSMNDAFKRLQYLRQYDKYRKRQAQLIKDTQESLQEKTDLLQAEKLKIDSLLTDLKSQSESLNEELFSKNRLLSGLKSEEKKLVRTIDQKEKAAQKLNRLIEDIIKKAMLASKKESKSNEVVESRESTITTGRFVNAKGRLPWPVSSGKISKPYGVYKHPKFKNVKVTNNGIDISASKNAGVKSVFSGEVAGVQFIPGFKNTIIIKHGRYYTVYSNLTSVYVKRGDTIEAQQEIGKVGATEPELHFEVWREKERLDPSRWIIRK